MTPNDKRSSKLAIAACVSFLLSSPEGASAFSAVVSEPRASTKSLSQIATESFSRTRRRSNSVSSRLQYSDGTDGHQPAVFKWWNTVFTTKEGSEKQEVVDEYLEFLDRRYKRLRSNEEMDSPNTFSALNWLTQGSKDVGVATEQQKEDSLYVLGVAGLASEKLLQKHQLCHETNLQQRPVSAASQRSQTATIIRPDQKAIVDVEIADSENSLRTKLTRQVIVPCIRVVYMLKRHLQFVNQMKRRLSSHLVTLLRSTATILLTGPFKAIQAIIEMGGGKKTIATAFTVATFVFILLRPILLAAVTEGPIVVA